MNAVPTTEDFAHLNKALGDPMRVEVLRVLANNSYGVLELAQIFGITQPRMSHHLKVLAGVDWVSTRREGSAIFYRRSAANPEQGFSQYRACVFATLDTCPLRREIEAGVEQVHQDRAQASSRFFVDNAEKFQAQQDLIASYPVYANAVTELLDSLELKAQTCALELGPGTGEFLLELSKRFNAVDALDNSATMLEKAQALAKNEQADNIHFTLGDSGALQNKENTHTQYDAIVANMVLHHTPSPQQVLKDLHPSLKPGGVLQIAELCNHDQTWAKEACGDVWLGFEPKELEAWAMDIGYTLGQSQYLALRNGFQIQIKQFIKPTG